MEAVVSVGTILINDISLSSVSQLLNNKFLVSETGFS